MTRTLLRGAQVITLAAGRPDWEPAAILIEDDLILDVGTNLPDHDAEVIDVTGRIIHPGLVNAHLHTWQTGLRSVGADWTLAEYLTNIHGTLAHAYRPEDMRIAALVGALGQLDGGTTTIGDWCHNNPTPAHTDAAIDGLIDAGIRTVFLHGAPYTKLAADSTRELDRILDGPGRQHRLLTIGMAIRGPQLSPASRAIADLRAATERGIIASMHQTGGTMKPAWDRVHEAGLFGPSVNLVHGAGLTDDWVRTLIDLGVTFTSTPENELGQGHSDPIALRLLRHGAAPSLGTDTDSVVSGDMRVAARMTLAFQRGARHNTHRAESGIFSPVNAATSRHALEWATFHGAQALGLASRIGRLEPGMQADLVIIDPRTVALWPAHDPIATALAAHPAAIEAVLVAGEWRKRAGALTHLGLPQSLHTLQESGHRILEELTSPALFARARRHVVAQVAGHRVRTELAITPEMAPHPGHA
ncbi:MAG TPA: amidohydrolase family protein [Microbacterium sp.]|uniref:amidohydrolase family protein n=1 Tax=Microbacterium sp. TaxID=51671 RepID=UPI002BB1C840|nr:amidohydrolase family protein [Microbacterium sp.]HWI30898.1 amidohydrolase family protein [Microbacterium sp.]